MLILGQAPSGRSGDAPDVLAMLRSHYTPDDGGQGGEAGDSGAGTDQGSGTETGKDGTPFDAIRAQRTIDRQTEELRTLRAQAKELADARARLKEIEDKDKSETERMASKAREVEAKLTSAEQRAADLALQMSVERAARKLGFIDEDDAYRLLDRKAVTLDDDGVPTNVETLLKDLAKAKPHLIASEDTGQRGTNGNATRGVPGTPKPAGNTQTQSRAAMIEQARKELAAGGRYVPL